VVYRLEEPFEMNQEEFQKAEVGSGWGRMVMLMEGCVLPAGWWCHGWWQLKYLKIFTPKINFRGR